MLQTIGRYAIALFAGAFLVAAIPWLLAGIAAIPGQRALIDQIRAAGLSVQYFFPLVTIYLPDFLFAFAVGFPVFQLLGGHCGKLLIAMLLPWTAMTVYVYVETCVGTDVSCFGAFPLHEFSSVLDVPLGLVLAALMARPPNAALPIDAGPVSRGAH